MLFEDIQQRLAVDPLEIAAVYNQVRSGGAAPFTAGSAQIDFGGQPVESNPLFDDLEIGAVTAGKAGLPMQTVIVSFFSKPCFIAAPFVFRPRRIAPEKFSNFLLNTICFYRYMSIGFLKSI